MTKIFIYILILSLSFSCNNPIKKTIQKTTNNEISTSSEKKVHVSNENPDILKKDINPTLRIKAKVISVEESLIMPSDYLTTTMTVKTDENKTYVFLDMFGFEKLVNQEITIEFKLTPRSKLLLCFDCSAHSEEINFYDITSIPSEIEFKELQLKKYIEDKWITPASTFEMIDRDGKIESYYSNDNDMILDSIKMKSSYFKYGIVTAIYPELVNRDELEQLIK